MNHTPMDAPILTPIAEATATLAKTEQTLARIETVLPVYTKLELEAMDLADRLDTLVRDFHEEVAAILAEAQTLSAKLGIPADDA